MKTKKQLQAEGPSVNKNTLIFQGTTFELLTKLVEEGAIQGNANSIRNLRSNHFRVTVKTDKGRISFKFCGSHIDWQNGVIDLFPNKFVFYCFVSDAVAAKNTFEDFCQEFGYDSDSMKAYQIYKECKKSLLKLNKIFNGDLYQLIENLND